MSGLPQPTPNPWDSIVDTLIQEDVQAKQVYVTAQQNYCVQEEYKIFLISLLKSINGDITKCDYVIQKLSEYKLAIA